MPLSNFNLDPTLPLLMLPVRLETRYIPANDELLIRIFPDVIHADSHVLTLSDEEQVEGQEFWLDYFQLAGDPAAQLDRFALLADQFSEWRAAWIARSLRPTNLDQLDPESIPDPIFPTPAPGPEHGPVYARLLPDSFVAVGYVDDTVAFEVEGLEITGDLVIGPDLATEVPDESVVDGVTFLQSQQMDWAVDFDAALAAGLGIRVDLTTANLVEDGAVDDLFVFGVSQGDRAEDFEALLLAHQFTNGLGLLAPGSATKGTDTTRPVDSAAEPELDALLATVVNGPQTAPVQTLTNPEDLLALDVGASTEIALGLSGTSPLQELDGARDGLLERAQAMNDVLWPVTWGYFFSIGMSGIVTDSGVGELRNWVHDWLRGGSAFGTLQVDDQVYGIVPHVEIAASDHPHPTDLRGRLEDVVAWLRILDWTSALQHVSSLNPNTPTASDASETGSSAVAGAAQAYGSVPNPMGFRARTGVNRRTEIQADYESFKSLVYTNLEVKALPIKEYLESQLDAPPDPPLGPPEPTVSLEVLIWQVAADDLEANFNTADPDLALALATIRDDIVPLLEDHHKRVEAPEHFPPGPGTGSETFPTNIQGDGPPLTWKVHTQSSSSWTGPMVFSKPLTPHSPVPPPPTDELAQWLDDAASWIEDPATYAEPDPFPGQPMLTQMVQRSGRVVHRWAPDYMAVEQARPWVVSGVRRLADMLTNEEVADPGGELERLLAETLGLATHRLDAWHTALALQILGEMRATRPTGVQIGCFGWLVDFRKDETEDPTHGYVHAPSPNHAAAAAVLRSGWDVLGGPSAASTAAIDLSSRQVQRARWLLEGVRRGNDLADLLGQRFERSLHDHGLDRYIDDVRIRVLAAAGSSDPPNAVVDGLMLARAFSEADDLTAAETALEVNISGMTGGSQVRPHLEALAADLDACGDLLLAQSVYGLMSGGAASSAASLGAIGSGDAPIPPIEMVDTPRRARILTHRMVVPLPATSGGSFPPAGTPAWPDDGLGPFASDAAHLDAWVRTLLPAPDLVSFAVDWIWEVPYGDDIVQEVFVRLDELGLGALDAVYLASEAPTVEAGPLADWVRVHMLQRTPPKPDAAPYDEPTFQVRFDDPQTSGAPHLSVHDWALLAQGVGELLRSARSLSAADLVDTFDDDESAPALDPSLTAGLPLWTEDQVIALHGQLDAALPDPTDPTDVLDEQQEADLVAIMLRLARFGFPKAVPTQIAGDGLVDEGRSLFAAVDDRVDAIHKSRATETERWSELDDDGRRASLIERIRQAAGHPFPPGGAVAAFVPHRAADLDASFGVSTARVDNPIGVRGWMRQVAAVRSEIANVDELTDLLDAYADRPVVDLDVGQLPHDAADPWWANKTLPEGEGTWLHLLRWRVPGFSFQGGDIVGFTVDAWTDSIPMDLVDTSIAIRYEPPASRPPNAMLLLVPKDGQWGRDRVRDKLKSVLDSARYRTVGPQHEERWGQYLPAIFMNDDAVADGGAS